jgi:hypothetical protein
MQDYFTIFSHRADSYSFSIYKIPELSPTAILVQIEYPRSKTTKEKIVRSI